jgi:hypothetical protein
MVSLLGGGACPPSLVIIIGAKYLQRLQTSLDALAREATKQHSIPPKLSSFNRLSIYSIYQMTKNTSMATLLMHTIPTKQCICNKQGTSKCHRRTIT